MGRKSCLSVTLWTNFVSCLQNNSVPWTFNSHYVISKWHQPNTSFIHPKWHPWAGRSAFCGCPSPCVCDSFGITGNFGLMYLIYFKEALHRPMYIFLAPLSFTDVLMCTRTLPNALCILWFNLKEIDFKACLAQMFFMHISQGCSCLWPWTTMWPSANPCTMLLSSQIQSLPRPGSSLFLEV